MSNPATVNLLCLDGIWRQIFVYNNINFGDLQSYYTNDLAENLIKNGNALKIGHIDDPIIKDWRGWDGDKSYTEKNGSYFYKDRTDSELLKNTAEAKEFLLLPPQTEGYYFVGICEDYGHCRWREIESDYDDCDVQDQIKFLQYANDLAKQRQKEFNSKPKENIQIDKIDDFRGHFFFLSNFYPCYIKKYGLVFKSTEALYQVAKLDTKLRLSHIGSLRKIFSDLTPNQSKVLGQYIPLRKDWDEIKISVMNDILVQKFQNPILKQKLLETGNAELIEGNTWNDRFWGVCKGEGENHLGKLLMQIREILKYQK